MGMDPAALLLLKDNEVAQRLIVAFPRLHMGRRGDRKRRCEVWAKLAGVRVADVQTFHDMLFDNEICTMDGTVAPLAASYVTRLALAKLPSRAPGTEHGPRSLGLILYWAQQYGANLCEAAKPADLSMAERSEEIRVCRSILNNPAATLKAKVLARDTLIAYGQPVDAKEVAHAAH